MPYFESRRLAALLALAGAFLSGPSLAAPRDAGSGPGDAALSDRVLLRTISYSAAHGPTGASDADLESRDAAIRGEHVWIVTVRGPADAEAREAFARAGGRIVGWVPSNAYLVRGTGKTALALRKEQRSLRVDLYEAAWKISPTIGLTSAGDANDEVLFTADLFEGALVAAVADEARSLGFDVLRVEDTARVRRLLVRAPADGVSGFDRLAAFADVEWIEEAPRAALRNDVVRWVLQSNVTDVTPVTDRGLLGAGQIFGHIDGPIAITSCFFRDPNVAIPGPTHRKLLSYHNDAGFAVNDHGTHVAGTLAGDQEPINASTTFRGMAPKARIAFTSFFDVDGFNNTISNLDALLTRHHDEGARVHSNSWGQDGRTDYVTWCRDIDIFTRAHEDDLVLFAVSNLGTLAIPENAKNVLAVGAASRPSFQEQIGSAGTGPTADGRRKPEVFACGISTVSASTGSCGTATLSGTSMATPVVAGGAALIREYLMRGFYPTGGANASREFTPTGALVKAIAVNACRDMTDVPLYPGAREGWGRVTLGDALYFSGDDERLWLRDVRHVEGLATGETDAYNLRVVDSSIPLRVTLVFTDQPAALGALVTPINDLDLEVEGPGGIFFGNVFDTSAGVSTTGGADDPLNNVERVILASPLAGEWTVRVQAENVPLGPQGYAIVVNGGLFPATRTETVAPAELAAEEGKRAGLESGGEISLASPRPNPYSSESTYRLTISAAAPLRLAIYDVTGRLVRLLADRSFEAGVHDLVWDGRDNNGSAAPSGIYFARLTGFGVERRVKGVLLR